MSQGLPNVNISILNNQLGRDVTNSEEYLLVLTGIAVAGKIALNEVHRITSIEEAEALGLDTDYDTANSVNVHADISTFFDTAGKGTPLWVLLISEDTTMTDALDKTGAIVKKALSDAGGAITMAGINVIPNDTYNPTIDNGIDPDVITAVAKAQELIEEAQSFRTPLRILVGGRAYTGVAGDLHDFSKDATNGVGVVIGSAQSDGYPAVALALGISAEYEIHEAISKVQNGAVFTLGNAYTSAGGKIKVNDPAEDMIYNKRYISFRKFANRDGFYFTGFLSACDPADDFSEIQRGRVIDRGLRVAYDSLINQIDNDLETNEDGTVEPAIIKDIEGSVEEALNSALVTTGSASGVKLVMPTNQNVVQTDQLVIEKIGIRPKGYPKYIDVNLGLSN
ncbi:DUF2586 family protein [Flammeovirga aprica]|uniref:DUF2586 family protein n=1 Tax=Flammeovirga aprica JL-4 TaxID=694437 RepID=A0A7X9RUR6_9BACT|nr:DUF2586 family protein [Flammeovirga aprica]NME69009.1 hypothetical protein [Flammeovirga aprica JL-4]